MNRVQVVLSGFSMRLFCFVQAKTLCRYGCMYFLAALVHNSLPANTDKTQVTAFYLRNREAKRSLKVSWNGVDLENTTHPKYLGVTLDRTLSYKQHTQNTKMKVAIRNIHLKKLTN